MLMVCTIFLIFDISEISSHWSIRSLTEWHMDMTKYLRELRPFYFR